MVTKIQKWGNSQGLRFSKEMLEQVDIEVGDEVQLSVRGGRIIVEPLSRVRGRYKLKDLLAQIPKGHRSSEVDWGKPAGKEAW